MSQHRLDARPHLYELFVLANLLLIIAISGAHRMRVVATMPAIFASIGQSLLLQMLAGVVVRFIVGAIRGNWRAYAAVIRRPAWIAETLRLLISGTLVVHTYCWIKISVPLLHPVLYDQQLWDIDQHLFFGLSPNLFFLNLFSNRAVLHVIDATYANVFIASMTVAFAYFLSSPVHRLRTAFMSGNAVMWLIGAWLYMLIPSLGPAYRFPEVWLQYARDFRITEALQARLWQTYRTLLAMRSGGRPGAINILEGIAAFPSLHVAFQTFVFFWFRRLWRGGQVLFAFFVFIIFVGSMVTGWHYLIDAIAGVLLAYATYALMARIYRAHRWSDLRALR